MDIVAVRTFLAAAAVGSFAGAAQRLNTSPSTVTERIKQLEHDLAARLFERNKRGCALTEAGERFMASALKLVRTWDAARQQIAAPNMFSGNLLIGGQFALWHLGLLDWLAERRDQVGDIALHAAIGSSSRLGRDLAEGLIDMAVIYDPVFRQGIIAEKLFDDDLVLVTAAGEANWRERYVHIEWGAWATEQIMSRLDLRPKEGLTLDLGMVSVKWIVEHRMTGFVPRRLIKSFLDGGQARAIAGAPVIEYPAFICWRAGVDDASAQRISRSIMEFFEEMDG